ncbi:MAG: ribonuclease P protein subunit [Candidatus Marsarchaeota archaeon]|jgi:ribonuclease P protein subunit POP4|nr:ribonuclease P protein subunit [Candidatus Marsarchaeota archaeon]MCL5112244.1 ribonuclease P protein subunit [Candidatus Marsarchaeota archaeon]
MGIYNNRNIVLHELNGLRARVVNCSDSGQIGISGTVVMETKNTLHIKDGARTRIVAKKNSVFEFLVDGERFVVNGDEISFRPHERLEKAIKFYRKRKA